MSIDWKWNEDDLYGAGSDFNFEVWDYGVGHVGWAGVGDSKWSVRVYPRNDPDTIVGREDFPTLDDAREWAEGWNHRSMASRKTAALEWLDATTGASAQGEYHDYAITQTDQGDWRLQVYDDVGLSYETFTDSRQAAKAEAERDWQMHYAKRAKREPMKRTRQHTNRPPRGRKASRQPTTVKQVGGPARERRQPRTAWTEDGSDITPVANKLMAMTEALEEEYSGLVVQDLLVDQIRPMLSEVTQKDIEVLEDYNYHTTVKCVMMANGQSTSSRERKQTGAERYLANRKRNPEYRRVYNQEHDRLARDKTASAYDEGFQDGLATEWLDNRATLFNEERQQQDSSYGQGFNAGTDMQRAKADQGRWEEIYEEPYTGDPNKSPWDLTGSRKQAIYDGRFEIGDIVQIKDDGGNDDYYYETGRVSESTGRDIRVDLDGLTPRTTIFYSVDGVSGEGYYSVDTRRELQVYVTFLGNSRTNMSSRKTADDASNWVRDYFLDRGGIVPVREISTIFNPVAQATLERLIADEYIQLNRDGDVYEWPMQMYASNRKTANESFLVETPSDVVRAAPDLSPEEHNWVWETIVRGRPIMSDHPEFQAVVEDARTMPMPSSDPFGNTLGTSKTATSEAYDNGYEDGKSAAGSAKSEGNTADDMPDPLSGENAGESMTEILGDAYTDEDADDYEGGFTSGWHEAFEKSSSHKQAASEAYQYGFDAGKEAGEDAKHFGDTVDDTPDKSYNHETFIEIFGDDYADKDANDYEGGFTSGWHEAFEGKSSTRKQAAAPSIELVQNFSATDFPTSELLAYEMGKRDGQDSFPVMAKTGFELWCGSDIDYESYLTGWNEHFNGPVQLTFAERKQAAADAETKINEIERNLVWIDNDGGKLRPSVIDSCEENAADMGLEPESNEFWEEVLSQLQNELDANGYNSDGTQR